MNTRYRADLKAHLSLDEREVVRHIRHSGELWLSEQNIPRKVAEEYLHAFSEVLQFPKEQLSKLYQQVSYFEPREQGAEFHLGEEKHLFDATTVSYCQTFLNVPVWRKGLSVSIKQNPYRVVDAINTSEANIRAKLPDAKVIERYRRLVAPFDAKIPGAARGTLRTSDEATSKLMDEVLAPFGTKVLRDDGKKAERRDPGVRLLNGRFFIYRYDAANRFGGHGEPSDQPKKDKTPHNAEEEHFHPTLKLPAVDAKVKDGQAYLVVELRFEQHTAEFGHVVWLVLVELETDSILFVKPLTCGVNGLVFPYDPITSSGVATNSSNQSNAVLNPFRVSVTLDALDAPVAGTQNLRGTYVQITEVENPVVAPPTRPAGANFDFDARTNNFAAVSAYYHETELFQTIESLGFPRNVYFDGTTFPIPVDARGMGNTINAHWAPNGTGGTAHMCYALADDTAPIPADTIGRATDKWVHWHEMAGHGSLGDHVNDGTFPFAHSAGDGLAALQNDPVSALRALPLRFRYAPFRPGLDRFFGGTTREVSAGWGWGGVNDTNGYNSEQILAACHFQIYRSIGGDSNDVNTRWFASRAATYLILRGIGELTEAVNADTPLEWCEKLMAVDLKNWTSEGLFGGAYNKVIRWAFEKRGLFQPPGAPAPVTTPGAPPQIDVYIDDGRGGEYDHQPVHWANPSMWNRNSPDGLTAHQNAIIGATNYMYVKIKNRGTAAAANVVAKGFHCLPGAGLTWPTDFTSMNPAVGLPVASVGANNSETVTVGPFEWTPNLNAYGHDCVLMILSAAGDPSNVDHFTPGESIAEWRLVPHDNNIGQRNVTLVAGGGGESLMASLKGAFFMAGNTFNKLAAMELRVEMPRLLLAKGWKLQFAGLADNQFRLKPGEKRRIELDLVKGEPFTAAELKGDDAVHLSVQLYGNGILMGGMTYSLDPDLKPPKAAQSGSCAVTAGGALLDCLRLSGAHKVKKVCVKKITVDLEIDNDCGCD